MIVYIFVSSEVIMLRSIVFFAYSEKKICFLNVLLFDRHNSKSIKVYSVSFFNQSMSAVMG